MSESQTRLYPKLPIRIVNRKSSLKIHFIDFIILPQQCGKLASTVRRFLIFPFSPRERPDVSYEGGSRDDLACDRLAIEAPRETRSERKGEGIYGDGSASSDSVIPRFVDVAVGIDAGCSGMCRLYQWQ